MKLPPALSVLLCASGILALSTSAGVAAEDFYVGTYTHWYGSKGIYHFQLAPSSGTVSGGELAAKTANPSFLAIHPNRHWLYAPDEGNRGTVNAFAIAPDYQLRLINQQKSWGEWPCHVSLDRSHRYVFVANYNSGTVAVLPIQRGGGVGAATGFNQQTGHGPNADRQQAPYAHSIYADPANRFVYSCDLGNDRVEGYRFHPESGTLTPSNIATTRIAPGSGPRHLVLGPQGYVYVVNEMGCTVTVLRRDEASGAMHTLQTVSTLPAGFAKENTCAEIALHPNGRFLYASNRGHDSIAVFAVRANGRLTPVEYVPTGGRTPRNFAIDPSGRWLLAANQKSNDIFVFAVNGRTGRLTRVGNRTHLTAPVCVAFMPTR